MGVYIIQLKIFPLFFVFPVLRNLEIRNGQVGLSDIKVKNSLIGCHNKTNEILINERF